MPEQDFDAFPRFPFDHYQDVEAPKYAEMMDWIVENESIQAEALGVWLQDRFKPKSVIDLGCGPGLYLLPFKEAGAEVFGVDACETAGAKLSPEEFERVDLREPYCPKHRFDLAICFEVVEHIHPRFNDRLVDTLWDCSDVILFTGATPGQGGSFHKNEQTHEYWLDLFLARHGYVLHPFHDAMRAFLEQLRPLEAEGKVAGWLLNNSFLLWRPRELRAAQPWHRPE